MKDDVRLKLRLPRRQSIVGKLMFVKCRSLGLVILAVCTFQTRAIEPTGEPDGPLPRSAQARMNLSIGSGVLTSEDFRTIVRLSTDRVFPAVVFLKCIRQGLEGGRTQAMEVTGSGVIISAAGEVVTNWHVVDKAKEIRCQLYDGQGLSARVVGYDKDTDLALLQLEVDDEVALPNAALGDSECLEAGDFVMAMGAPWGLSRSVSIGIISSTRRYLEGNSEYSLWLQTDCAISPGNSGGPLVNTVGEVIGITSRGALMGGDLAFAIPSATVAKLVARIREFGSADWSWYGLELQPLRDFNRNMYFEGDKGVIVAGTTPGGPARLAGLQVRDRILSIDGTAISAITEEDLPAIRTRLGMVAKGEPLQLVVERDGRQFDFAVTPRAKGLVEGEEYDCTRWDMTVKAINRFDNPSLCFYRAEGVYILGLRSPGNAMDAGLRRQDIILEIDGQEIRSLENVKARHQALVTDANSKSRVVLTVLRGGLQRQVVLNYARDYQRE